MGTPWRKVTFQAWIVCEIFSLDGLEGVLCVGVCIFSEKLEGVWLNT